jgi:hypothetical protein
MKEEASSSTSTSDEDLRVRLKDVTDEAEDLSAARHGNDNPPDESSGSEPDDEAGDAHTQSSANTICPTSRSDQPTAKDLANCSRDVSFELQASSPAKIGGNIYSHVRVSNDARLHLGDSITINNYHRDPKEVGEQHIVARVEITQEFIMTLSAAVGLVRALLQTTTGLFLVLQVVMSGYRLPKQINDELVTFEDALGRFQRIDLRFLDSWPAFRRRLECDFQEHPGSRRILEMRYRLFDRNGGNHLVNPQHPPPFAELFKQGCHVQMSIHFEWSEVSDEQCPRCGLEQECKVNAETICAGCSFNYRGQVENARVEEVEDEEAALAEYVGDTVNNARPKSAQRQRDMLSSFSRVTISKQPARSAKRRPARRKRPERNSHHEWHAYSARQAIPTISSHDSLTPSTERAQPSQPVLSARYRSDMPGSFPREPSNFGRDSDTSSSSESSDSEEEERYRYARHQRRRDEKIVQTQRALEAKGLMPPPMLSREPGGRRPTLTHTRTDPAEPERTRSRGPSRQPRHSEPPFLPSEYVDSEYGKRHTRSYARIDLTPSLSDHPSSRRHISGSVLQEPHVVQQYVVEDANGRRTCHDTLREAEAKARRLKLKQQIDAAEAYQATTTSALTVKRAQQTQQRKHRKPTSHVPGSKRKSTTTESIQTTRDGTTFSIPTNTTLQIRQTEEGETWIIGSGSPPREHSYYGDTSKSPDSLVE